VGLPNSATSANLVCPLCVAYLDGSNETEEFIKKHSNMKLLKNYVGRDTVVKFPTVDGRILTVISSHSPHEISQQHDTKLTPHSPTTNRPTDSEQTTKLTSKSSSNKSYHQKNSPAAPSSIFQHRLLMDMFMPSASIKDITTNDDPPSKRKKVARTTSKRSINETVEDNWTSNNLDKDNHQLYTPYADDVPLSDRVRKCLREDGTAVNIRVQGGWMVDNKSTTMKKSPSQHVLIALASTSSSEQQSIDKFEDEEVREEKRLIREKILQKLRTSPLSLAARAKRCLAYSQRQHCIEKAVSIAPTGANSRRKTVTHHSSSDWNIFSGSRAALCMLPTESGGLRHCSLSHVIALKSIHTWCCTHICAFCLREKSVLRGSSDSDGLTLVETKFGVVSYFIHLQCQFSLETTPLATANRMNSSGYIRMGEVYEYKRPDDVECDLCGLRGGILRYFSLDEASSSLPQPSPAGWLAHISCCFHLANSLLLQPFNGGISMETSTSSGTLAETRKRTISEYFLSALRQSQSISRSFELVDKFASTGNRSATTASNERVCDPVFLEEPSGIDDIRCVLDGIVTNIESRSAHTLGDETLLSSALEDQCEVERYSRPVGVSDDINIIKSLLSSMIDELSATQVVDACLDVPISNSTIAILSEKDVIEESPALQPLSRFDLGLRRWRCSLCGLTAGLTLRCCALACTLRCHPICAGLYNLAVFNGSEEVDRTWILGLLCSTEIDRNGEAGLGMLCPAHNKIN